MTRPNETPSERGIALVTALLMTLILVVMGAGLIVSSRGAQRIETGFKNQQRTFEVAVAGLERAREILRHCRFDYINSNGASSTSCSSISNKLDVAAGADDTLVDVTSIAAFEAAGGLSVDDVPLVADTVLGDVTYRVYLTNDPWDDPAGGATVKTDGVVPDGQNVVTLTAFARGANDEGWTAAQGIFRTGTTFPLPTLPGLITLPGPSIDYLAPTSNAIELNGDYGDPLCFATVATSTNDARDDAIDEIDPREDNYTTCDPGPGSSALEADTGSVENFIDTSSTSNPYAPLESNDPQLAAPGNGALGGVVAGCNGDERDFIRTACMNGLVASVTAQANALVAAGRGYVGPSPTTADLGSPSLPTVVVVTGNYTAPPGDYGGTLLVRGNLTTHGNFSYTGQILVVGNGWVRRNGGGSGSICGGVLTANTNVPWVGDNNYVGIPHYDHAGGGTTFQGKCGAALQGEILDWSLPMARIAFQQLR